MNNRKKTVANSTICAFLYNTFVLQVPIENTNLLQPKNNKYSFHFWKKQYINSYIQGECFVLWVGEMQYTAGTIYFHICAYI